MSAFGGVPTVRLSGFLFLLVHTSLLVTPTSSPLAVLLAAALFYIARARVSTACDSGELWTERRASSGQKLDSVPLFTFRGQLLRAFLHVLVGAAAHHPYDRMVQTVLRPLPYSAAGASLDMLQPPRRPQILSHEQLDLRALAV